jgi:two-component system sensor histidine kinase YesM
MGKNTLGIRIYRILKTKRLRLILLLAFIFGSIIPILILQYVSYQRLSTNFKDKIDKLSNANAILTKNILETTIASYEDLLYQIYTNDEIIALLEGIDNETEHTPVNINHIRTILRSMCYAKEGIESFAIITNNGSTIFYDKLTGAFVKSSWIDHNGMSAQFLLEKGMGDYTTKILPTQYTGIYHSKPYYLFHMVHCIIDYKHIAKDIGVAVLSLDEDLLQNICSPEAEEDTYGFIIDDKGTVISHADKTKIGSTLPEFQDHTIEEYKRNRLSVYSTKALNDWNIVSVIDQSTLYAENSKEMRLNVLTGIMLLFLSGLIIIGITNMFNRSINKITSVMQITNSDVIPAFIPEENIFSIELVAIAQTYNKMMERIIGLIAEIKSSVAREKDAEIKLLEAQINPHFLYNTLDSISWMAIEKDQFEISQIIVALANIMRYSINRNNEIVPLREEIEWLNQYIYLQKIRHKNSFDYDITIDESLHEYAIHKLMLQPFIENSINHGFKKAERKYLLQIKIWKDDGIYIQIRDNGSGIPPDVLEQIRLGAAEKGNHIGMANAIGRIKLYYGERAKINIENEKGVAITIHIRKESSL